jgi:hypothetical protein
MEDCGALAVGVRIQVPQPNPSIGLSESQQFSAVGQLAVVEASLQDLPMGGYLEVIDSTIVNFRALPAPTKPYKESDPPRNWFAPVRTWTVLRDGSTFPET